MTRRKRASSAKKKPSKKPIVAKKKVISPKRGKNQKPAKKPAARRVSAAKAVKAGKTKIIHMNNQRKPAMKRAKPRPQKKRKPSKKVLRERALKGWATRRKFERIDPSKKTQKLVVNEILPAASHRVTTSELLEELSKYRGDGAIAKYPSILRHVRDATILQQRLWNTSLVEGEEYVAVSADEVALTERFRFEALQIAAEYDVQIREVYTLFFSP